MSPEPEPTLPVGTVFRRLFQIAKPSVRALVTIFLLTLVGTLIAVAMPWPLQYLVDHVLGSKPPSSLMAHLLARIGLTHPVALVIAFGVASLGLHLFGGIIDLIRTRIEIAAGQGSVYRLREKLFDHYQRLSLQTHQAQPTGDQLFRLNHDTYSVDALIVSGGLPLLGSVLNLCLMFFILWRLDYVLALLALAVVPALATCVRYYLGPLEAESQKVLERESDIMVRAEQVFHALPLIKAFVREADESRRYQEHGQIALKARLKLTNKETLFGLIVGTVTAGGTALTLTVGALRVLQGHITVGHLLVTVAYLAAVYDPLHTISYTVGAMQSSLAGARRVLSIFALEAEEDAQSDMPPMPPIQGHVRFENVSFGYDPKAPVLKNVSLDAPPGSLVAIVGPTGAGKTTLAGLILRFFAVQQGRILIDGIDTRTVSVTTLRNQISLVPQDSTLFPASVADNIRYGRPDATDEDVRAAAVAAHADAFINGLAEGYATLLGEGGVSLSGGERQRIALARAFLKDAPILILDEPTSSLDAATESLILESLERLTAGRTTFVIAHRLSTIRRATQILYLQNGQIVERGTHRELIEDEGQYAEMHQLYVRAAGTS